MTLHPESLPLLRYLKNTVYELIEPLEQMEWAFWQEGDNTVVGYLTFSRSLSIIGVYFASVDGGLTDDEAAFLHDVSEFFSPDEPDGFLSPRLYGDILRNSIRRNPDI